MNLLTLVLTILAAICLIFGVVALINSSWITGAVLVVVGLILVAARTGRLTI